jgi:hypothetical protein
MPLAQRALFALGKLVWGQDSGMSAFAAERQF